MKALRSSPLVLGHRGYRARFPENTMLAFREALGAGADGIECDLQKTLDGSFVIIHDPRTGRVAGSDLEVSGSSLADLRSLDCGSGERIPTLEQVLQALPPGAWLDLELKEETIRPADCEAIAAILDASFSRSNLMVSSFDPRLLHPMRARGLRVGLLVGEETARRGLLAFVATLLRLRPWYVNLPIDMIRSLGVAKSRGIARLLRLLGFSLLFWTANEPGDVRFAASCADFIVTDEVGMAIDALREGFTGI